jgi:hypothetical protein
MVRCHRSFWTFGEYIGIAPPAATGIFSYRPVSLDRIIYVLTTLVEQVHIGYFSLFFTQIYAPISDILLQKKNYCTIVR